MTNTGFRVGGREKLIPGTGLNAAPQRSPSAIVTQGMSSHATDRDWERYGATDPYYGVIAHDEFRHGKLNDDAPCANHMTPLLAVDGKGRVHSAWLENRGGSGRVVSVECEPGATRCGPNIQVSDQPFADYALVRHSPRWLGEYHAIVVDDQRSVLHLVWTQTVDEDGKPRGRIFTAQRPLSKER